jgi:CBS domain containing-hemolysin-like protein
VKVAGAPGRALLRSLERFPILRPKHRLDPLEEIRHLIAAAEEAGSFGKQEQEILAALLRMQQEPSSSRMVPRTAMRFVGPGASRDEVLQAARGAKGGWLAVRGEGAEDIVGVLNPHDVLEWELGGAREPLSRWLHAVPVFPETRPLRLLFDEILRGGWPAAVLADEYGGVAGMVTRASLAESLLCGHAGSPAGGEADLLPGALPFVQLRERYGQVPEDPHCKTLAGHVLNLAQRVPAEGESFEDGVLRYTVRKATPRQVVEVEVEKVGKSS